jgi:hypothetical protein
MRQQAQNAVEMTITGVTGIFHPDRQMQANIPPLAKNEVMVTAKGARIENLQLARCQVMACACVFGVISHNLLAKFSVSCGVKSEQ